MAAEVAAPIAQAKKITMISSGDGEVGAAKLTGEVLEIMAKVPNLVKSLTGIDMAQVCASIRIHWNDWNNAIHPIITSPFELFEATGSWRDDQNVSPFLLVNSFFVLLIRWICSTILLEISFSTKNLKAFNVQSP